jgi:hypothetical protein
MGTSTQARLDGPILVRSRAVTDADTNTTVLVVDVPACTFVPPFGVTAHIITGFAGGTPSWDVGDGTTTNGWVASAEITETTAGMYTGTANYAAVGKYYASADTIDVVVATSATAGCGYLTVMQYDLSDEPMTAV